MPTLFKVFGFPFLVDTKIIIYYQIHKFQGKKSKKFGVLFGAICWVGLTVVICFQIPIFDILNTAMREISTSVSNDFYSYLRKTGYSESSIARAETLHYHEVNKRLAKCFGWNYTKKRDNGIFVKIT